MTKRDRLILRAARRKREHKAYRHLVEKARDLTTAQLKREIRKGAKP